MTDAAINRSIDMALSHDYRFCGWLPGFSISDVLRLQWVDSQRTDLNPGLVNPDAQGLLALSQSASNT